MCNRVSDGKARIRLRRRRIGEQAKEGKGKKRPGSRGPEVRNKKWEENGGDFGVHEQ